MSETLEPPQPQDTVPQGQQLQQPLASNGGLVNSAGENLQCQWRGCGERCTSPESLYVCRASTALVLAIVFYITNNPLGARL